MMKDIYDAEQDTRKIFDTADTVLNRSITDLCFDGSQEELNLTHNTQPTVLAADLAASAALQAHNVKPSALAGFSLGEYAALTYAGVISLEDAFRLIQIRADAMQDAVAPGEGAMAAFVGATAQDVEELCANVKNGYVVAANYNSPVQTVVSGTAAGVNEACKLADEKGLRCVKLAVSAPFHCALMEPAAMRLKEEFKNVTFGTPSIPVYMNVHGMPLKDTSEVSELLVRQAMSPVQWVKTLENLYADGIDTFIECGPGKTLSGLVKKTLKGVNIYRVENKKTLDDTLEKLGI